MEEEDLSNWEKHKKATNPIWLHFLKSVVKEVTKSNRYRAKCIYCYCEMEGKPDQLRKHLISSCTKIKYDIKSTIITTTTANINNENNQQTIESLNTSSSSSRKVDKSISSFFAPARISDQEANDLNLALLRSMISGGVSFNFVQDYWFAQFLHKLRPSYSLPSRTTLTDNYMVQLYADAVKERDEILSKIDCCTVLWDGWTDSSHNSIYGMMVLHGSDNQSELIDIVNLSMERHTATNMVNIVSDLWERSALKLSAIKCLVTDSPNVMLKF